MRGINLRCGASHILIHDGCCREHLISCNCWLSDWFMLTLDEGIWSRIWSGENTFRREVNGYIYQIYWFVRLAHPGKRHKQTIVISLESSMFYVSICYNATLLDAGHVWFYWVKPADMIFETITHVSARRCQEISSRRPHISKVLGSIPSSSFYLPTLFSQMVFTPRKIPTRKQTIPSGWGNPSTI